MKISALFTFLLIAFHFSNIAYAQTSDRSSAQAVQPNWLVTCNNHSNLEKLSCTTSLTIWREGTRQRIVSAQITPTNGENILRLVLPHGLNLQTDVGFSIDGDARFNLPIQTADANGSYAKATLKSGTLQAMKAGSILELSLKGARGKDIIIQLPLKGFTNAVDLMK